MWVFGFVEEGLVSPYWAPFQVVLFLGTLAVVRWEIMHQGAMDFLISNP